MKAEDRYRNLKTKENYHKLLESGMFWEFHPELSGDWNEDESIINQRQDMGKDQLSKLLKQEKEWTATFDSDVRVALALLDEIRKLNQTKEHD